MQNYVVYNWNGQLMNLVDPQKADSSLLNVANVSAVLLNLNFI